MAKTARIVGAGIYGASLPDIAGPGLPEVDLAARVPAARAVLAVWSYVFDDDFLERVFDEKRGACHERVLTFSRLVDLILDSLVRDRSGHRTLREQADAGRLEVSMQAVYAKLSRVPEAVSAALLGGAAQRVADLMPPPADAHDPVPRSLRGFDVIIADGKVVKNVAKRPAPARGRPGAVLGGKFLAALRHKDGIAIAFACDPDGESNEVKLLPALLADVRARSQTPRLWVADRAFGTVSQTAKFAEGGDSFLVRAHGQNGFHPDPAVAPATGTDSFGRTFTDDAGRLGAANHPLCRRVRRISVPLGTKEKLVLYTDLLDRGAFPADDLLRAYLRRADIESVFSQIVTTFGLGDLIGCSPRATLFQAALCLALYDTMVLLRALTARRRGLPPAAISQKMMFVDVRDGLVALALLTDPGQAAALVPAGPTAGAAAALAGDLLAAGFRKLWLKAAPPKTRRKPKPKPKLSGAHTSMHRLLLAAKRC